MFLLLPTYCLLASPHPKGFLIVIIPENISIKIIPDRYLVNRLDSFFQVHHLLSLGVQKRKGPKRRTVPSKKFQRIRLTLVCEI